VASPAKVNANSAKANANKFIAIYDNGDMYIGYGATAQRAMEEVMEFLEDPSLDDIRVYRIAQILQPTMKEISFSEVFE